MGSMKDLVGMILGVGKVLKNVDIDDDVFIYIEVIIYFMIFLERIFLDVINGSRKKCIVKGSGILV